MDAQQPARPAAVLAVIPHPDDEVLGAGGALWAARAAGRPATVLAVSLGRDGDQPRRRAELERSCHVLDVELIVLEPPLAISAADRRARPDALERSQERLTEELASLLAPARRQAPPEPHSLPLVIAPSVHDRHPAHELVGRAVRDALERAAAPASVWWWQLWGAGGPQTTAVVLDDAEPELLRALGCHAGELQRNRYGEYLSCRLRVDAVLGAELLFGFGTRGWSWTCAALYCETLLTASGWCFAEPRVIKPAARFGAGEAGSRDATAWLRSTGERGHLTPCFTRRADPAAAAAGPT